MNAKKMYLSVFLGVLLLSSCKTARDMVSENDICGEWNVVEIQGEPVRAQSNPFIGFDTRIGSYGIHSHGLSRYGIGRKTYRSVVYGKER